MSKKPPAVVTGTIVVADPPLPDRRVLVPYEALLRRYLESHGTRQTITVNRGHVETFTNCLCPICLDALAILGETPVDGANFGG